MNGFLLSLLLVFALATGGRDQWLVARWADSLGRSTRLLALAMVCACFSAAAMAWVGAEFAALLPHRAAQMLVAFALAIAFPPLAIVIALLMAVAAVVVIVALRRLLRNVKATLKRALGDEPPAGCDADDLAQVQHNFRDAAQRLQLVRQWHALLKPGAAVRSAGVVVGREESIAFDDQTFQASITLTLEKRYGFPKDSSMKILTSGLLGEQYIGIEPGGDPANIAEGAVITQTQSALVLENLIGQFLFNRAAEGSDKPAAAE